MTLELIMFIFSKFIANTMRTQQRKVEATKGNYLAGEMKMMSIKCASHVGRFLPYTNSEKCRSQ
jgi:hypothetical protein